MAGMENESKSTGTQVTRHFHVLMTARHPIPESLAKQTWREMVGLGRKDILHPEGTSIVLKALDPTRPAVEYCLKFADHCQGEWFFRWLEIFNPKIPRSALHRERRRRRRSAGG